MFGTTYTEEVTVRRVKPASMGVSGRPEYEVLRNADDDTPVVLRCLVQQRGRVTIDAQQRQIRTDATLLYMPEGVATLRDSDFVVRADGSAYEVVGLETLHGQWGGPAESRVDLVRTAIPVKGGAP